MTDKEIRRMQRRIDEGIQLAHHRLWKRASLARQSLIVWRNGKVVEIVPEENADGWLDEVGDPLARRRNLQ